jgi:hypothetical protein
MRTLQGKTGINREKQIKAYSVIQLFINSMRFRPVRKRFLNFYNPVLPGTSGSHPNEAKRIP